MLRKSLVFSVDPTPSLLEPLHLSWDLCSWSRMQLSAWCLASPGLPTSPCLSVVSTAAADRTSSSRLWCSPTSKPWSNPTVPLMLWTLHSDGWDGPLCSDPTEVTELTPFYWVYWKIIYWILSLSIKNQRLLFFVFVCWPISRGRLTQNMNLPEGTQQWIEISGRGRRAEQREPIIDNE